MISMPQHLNPLVDENGAVILDIPNNRMNTLNPAGAYIWERLQKDVALDQIIADLVRDTGADEAIVAIDVEEFMDDLKSKRLVTIRNSRTPRALFGASSWSSTQITGWLSFSPSPVNCSGYGNRESSSCRA